MEIIILLVAIMLLGRIKNVNESTEYKIVVGSIMGISFFFIWPYVYFVTQILSWSETYTYTSYLILILLSMSLVLGVTMVRISVYAPILAIVVLIMSWVASTAFDIQIKNELANKFGYYSDDKVKAKKISGDNYRIYKSIEGGYNVLVPVNWKQKKYKNIGLTYFTNETDLSDKKKSRGQPA